MHVFELVIWIVAICVIGGIIKSYLDRNNPKASGDVFDNLMNDLGMGDYYSKKDLAPFMERFEAMEQRIQVLERIATDKGRNLASEIDDLKQTLPCSERTRHERYLIRNHCNTGQR